MAISEGQWNVLRARRAVEDEAITANETGVLVRAGNVLYGIDAQSRRHILVPVGKQPVIEDRGSQGVQIGTRSLVYRGATTLYADLVCLMPRFNGEFGHIAEDVLAALVAGADPGSACCNSLEKWRDLLRTARTAELDERAAVGLFGELSLLLELSGISPRATELWTGPGGGRFDFIGEDAAIEVKATTRRYGRLVEISGESQLDAPPEVVLYLAFFRLEQVPAGGTRLWDVLSAIRQAGVSVTELQRRLDELEVSEASLQTDQKHYRVLETRLYSVDQHFPKIVPASFIVGEVPPGTMRLRYMIDLSGEPPSPLDSGARDAVLRRLLRRGMDGA